MDGKHPTLAWHYQKPLVTLWVPDSGDAEQFLAVQPPELSWRKSGFVPNLTTLSRRLQLNKVENSKKNVKIYWKWRHKYRQIGGVLYY